MSISLLQELSDRRLPLDVKGGDIVDAVHILVLAGHVEAEIAKAARTSAGWMHPTAVVRTITPAGRRMLALFPPRPGRRRRLGSPR